MLVGRASCTVFKSCMMSKAVSSQSSMQINNSTSSINLIRDWIEGGAPNN